jgi:tRNA pseudouridine32 synthase / 23S rRNA pseudouridine746 synthase
VWLNPTVDILHVDSAIIVLNKPVGLPVLPDGWEQDAPYLVRQLEEQFGSASGDLRQSIWIVHRLDKSTSGVIVFARTAEAHRDLSMQFERHQAEKIYHAIILGLPAWEEKIAKHPLRLNVGHKHRTAVDPKGGKPSETRFKVIERYDAHVLVQAQIMTGRTHQIRAHAYALGHPLLGDTLYSAPETDLIARPALHAYTLSILHPTDHQRFTYTAPYPEDFSKALERLSV